MSVKEIVDRYCERYGLRIIHGKKGEDDPAPILPFIIMDSAQSEFNRAFTTVKVHHDLKKTQKAWKDDYHRFNQRLFSCLNEDQRDFVIDLMDEYEDFIQNSIMLMRVAWMDMAKDIEFEDQKIVASLMLCNIFSQVAQIGWGLVFRTDKGNEQRCPELERMRNYSHKLANAVVYFPYDINPNKDTKLHDAVDDYLNKTTKWLKSYDRKG